MPNSDDIARPPGHIGSQEAFDLLNKKCDDLLEAIEAHSFVMLVLTKALIDTEIVDLELLVGVMMSQAESPASGPVTKTTLKAMAGVVEAMARGEPPDEPTPKVALRVVHSRD